MAPAVTEPARPAGARLGGVLALLLVVAVVWLAYRPMLDNNFVSDDWQHLDNVVGRSTGDYVDSVLDARRPHYFYRPIPRLLMYAEYRLFGARPVIFHLTSILVHTANCLLWGLLLALLTGRWLVGSLAALLYGVFPVFADAVFWISDTEVLLALFFALLCLLFWRRFLHTQRASAAVAALGCLAGALLCKEGAAILLPVLFLSLWGGAWRGSRRRWVALAAALLALGSVYLVLDLGIVARDVPLAGSAYSLGPHALANLWRYLALLATPLQQWATQGPWAALRVAGLAALALIAWRLRPRAALFLIVWTGLALLPYLWFNDRLTLRYTYAAAAGASGLAAVVLAALLDARHGRRPAAIVLPALGLAALAVWPAMQVQSVHARELQFAATTHIQENVLYHVQALTPGRGQSFAAGSSLYFLNAPAPGRYLRSMFHLAYGQDLRVAGSDEGGPAPPAGAGSFHVFYYRGDTLEELRFAPPLPAIDTARPLPVRFGPDIDLAGYSLPGLDLTRPLLLLLSWQAHATPGASYTVFAHLLDGRGQTVSQADSRPQEGRSLTSSWQPGQRLGDYLFIPLPPQAPPGEYRLRVGLYDLNTMQRLPILDAAGAASGDDLIIGPFSLR